MTPLRYEDIRGKRGVWLLLNKDGRPAGSLFVSDGVTAWHGIGDHDGNSPGYCCNNVHNDYCYRPLTTHPPEAYAKPGYVPPKAVINTRLLLCTPIKRT